MFLLPSYIRSNGVKPEFVFLLISDSVLNSKDWNRLDDFNLYTHENRNKKSKNLSCSLFIVESKVWSRFLLRLTENQCNRIKTLSCI